MTGLFIGKRFIQSTSKEVLLPSFKGVIEVRHMLKGRIRFYIPKLIGNEEEKEMLMDQIIRLNSVENVEISTLTGSLLIFYDQEKIEPMLLFSVVVRLLGLEEKLDKKEKSILYKEIEQFGSSINKSVLENTRGLIDAKTLLPVTFIIWGLKKIIVDKNSNTPQPYTLFWWGYNLLKKG